MEERKQIELGTQRRTSGAAEIRLAKEKDVTRLSFSLSSETPVERFYGTEVLSHDPKAVRLDRASSGAMPLLFNHNWDDPVGIVDRAYVDGGRLMIDAHLFDTARAREVSQMVEGGLRNVSVGYDVHEFVEDPKRGKLTATDWTPMEASIVTIPADFSVGIGRSEEGKTRPIPVRQEVNPAAIAAPPKEVIMTQETTPAAGAAAAATQPTPAPIVTDGFDPVAYEKGRSETIRKFAAANEISDEKQVQHWIRSGKSWDEIASDILKVREERAKASPAVLGLTPSETQRYSIVRAIRASIDRDWSKAGFEAEVSRAAAQRSGKTMNEFSFIVPLDVLKREMIVGTASSGGYLVGTQNQPSSFIDILRNRSVAMRLGMRTMSGLSGPVTIPTQAASGAVGWLLESGTATENNLTVGQKSMAPKTVGGYQQISRSLLMQASPDAEGLVNADLAALVALKVDAAVLAGTSTDSSVPLGIRYQSGLGTANPTSGTAIAYGDMIRFQSTVAASNALFDSFGYVCHPQISALLMGKSRFTNSDTPIWEGALLDGQVVGKRAMASLQVTSGTILGGDWTQVILGEWGTVEIETNPFANFQAGIIGIRAFYSCDVLVRYGAAFAIGTGITG